MTPEQIRLIRVSLGLTQAEAAALVGVHRMTWAHWEQGVNQPGGPTVRLLRMIQERAGKGETNGKRI